VSFVLEIDRKKLFIYHTFMLVFQY